MASHDYMVTDMSGAHSFVTDTQALLYAVSQATTFLPVRMRWPDGKEFLLLAKDKTGGVKVQVVREVS